MDRLHVLALGVEYLQSISSSPASVAPKQSVPECTDTAEETHLHPNTSLWIERIP